MSSLPRANLWLKLLLRELRRRGLTSAVRGIKLRASKVVSARNAKSPRAFCQVTVGSSVIECAPEIEALPQAFIVGILLHEVAHIILESEPGDPELNVDEFVLDQVEDSGYAYRDAEYVTVTDEQPRWRKAKNIEWVRESFLERLKR